MSEYQYYEFQAIDRPLDAAAQSDLHDISSRAQITSSSFTNEYNYGDLRADPEQMLLRWFDAMLYVANWGTRWLSFRLPRGAIRSAEIAPYMGEAVTIQEDENYILVHFRLNEEESRYEPEPEGVLAGLLPLREALLSGDLRSLYLGWLLDVQWGVSEEDDEEPPLPAGLGTLDEALIALVEFLSIDEDLIAAAAETSGALAARKADAGATKRWLSEQSAADKDAWLLRVLDGDGGSLSLELRRHLREATTQAVAPAGPLRRAGALLQRAETLERARLQREEAEREQKRRLEAERRAAEREQHLDRLKGKDELLWQQAEQLVAVRQAKEYAKATEILMDLRDLAAREGRKEEWSKHFEAFRLAHVKKAGLMRRLDET